MQSLLVNEVFHSIQGEGSYAGYPCIFIRLMGCPLRCTWCDTKYSFYEGEKTELADLLEQVNSFNCQVVEVTGGEPLAQKNTISLLEQLVTRNKLVLLETSGALPIDKVPKEVHIVLDLKAPGSNEEEKNVFDNLALLKPSDDIKIVIADRNDFEWAVKIQKKYLADREKPVFLQPVYGQLGYETLADWVKEHSVFRLGIQLQKHIYNPRARGV